MLKKSNMQRSNTIPTHLKANIAKSKGAPQGQRVTHLKSPGGRPAPGLGKQPKPEVAFRLKLQKIANKIYAAKNQDENSRND